MSVMKDLGRILAEGQRQGLSAEDAERIEFLKRLDVAPVEVSDWEANFIESFLVNARPMTVAQRAAVDGMRDKYEGSLNG